MERLYRRCRYQVIYSMKFTVHKTKPVDTFIHRLFTFISQHGKQSAKTSKIMVDEAAPGSK